MNGTSSSGVLPKNYVRQWIENDGNNTISIVLHPSERTTGIRTLDSFLIFLSRDATTAKVTQKLSPTTQYWLHEKLPAYQKRVRDQFYTLHQRQDNWDSRGSQKPNRLSLSYAEGIITDLLDSITQAGYIWLTPSISSDEDGNITIEWHKGKHELHIEVGENEAEYIKVWGTSIENEMHLDFLDRKQYLTLWSWLLHG
ncbi:MAG: hypothetical protein JSR32_00390 [Proteobacteria bacterium]|nr:hypothetical protein [Pseudomonadota bacterium]